ncbi:glycosyltransferase family 2 protein [Corynebacterium epidermidicanis]|uniref:Glycosyl transferase n=1 Tax=Corynebacterium epidermidicanis TaxID=1050174 RepID=A0A0G3GU82_9CORY|nr:glycosyltransferase family 2 protein [Corynebacterium epidermidicanis]AKK02422.1 glycosyl transferase [Corynebacterium epidermidicanis]
MVSFRGEIYDIVLLVSVAAIVLSLAYLAMLLVLSRVKKPKWRPRNYDSWTGTTPEIVFVMPCLNEATVVGASLQRLLAMDYPRLSIVVIDDGSDDGTGDIVKQVADPRVHLFQRTLPNARKGKGKALNDAFQFIYDGGINPHIDPENTILVVVDADGRMDRRSLDYVIPAFDDPMLAGVQIGVRINNRVSNMLARMQDLEFVLYTEVFQRGRVKLNSVGLGGNGQFVRLSALRLLGRDPWSDSLTEDLDLGIRLHLLGFRLDYCPEVAVHQQGLEDLGRWIRQRTRWFQGYLQGWNQVANILVRLWGTARIDLFWTIASPILLLCVTFFTASFLVWLVAFGIGFARGTAHFGWQFLVIYLLAFGPTLVLSFLYRKNEPQLGIVKALLLGHAYVFYAQLWGIAGWKAVWNQLRGRTGWAKTERVAEVPEAETPELEAERQPALEPGPIPQPLPDARATHLHKEH